MSGTVSDSTGAVVASAKVDIINTQTGQTRNVNTNDEGRFVFTELLPGTFTLTINAPGFKKYEHKEISVSATERVTLPPITLEIGGLNEIVSVTGEAAAVQTESAERSGLINERQMQELPLKGRSYMGTTKLLPGIVDTANRESPGWNDLVGININGTRSGSIDLNLDGITSLDTGSMTGPYLAPSIDAVAEVKVLLSNYQAEYGRASGGTINTVIKSGTRDFHGGAYYFLRNEDLNANEFFNNKNLKARPRYRYNYPGYFVGGPVLLPGTDFNKTRNKLFFFWSQEFLPQTVPSSIYTDTFPTTAERGGDFSQSGITVTDPLNNGIQFPNNVVPASRGNQYGQALMNLLPTPNTVGPGNQYNWAGVSINKQPRRDSILRLDYNIDSKNQFYTRLIQDYQATQGEFGLSVGLGGNNNWPQFPMNYQIHSAGAVATWIHTFSPTSINELTWGINRAKQTVTSLTQARLEANVRSNTGLSGLPQFYPSANPQNLVPNTSYGGITNSQGLNMEQRFPFFGTNNIWDYSDNFSYIVGSHSFKAGLFLEHGTRNAARSTYFNGTFAFDRDASNPLDSGYAYSNGFMGIVDVYTESNKHPAAHGRYTQLEWYVQDSWKVNRRVTVDYGARFYFIQPALSANDKLAAFDLATYDRSKQPALVTPYLDPATGKRVGLDPATGTEVAAVKIGTFGSSGTPFQGMVTHQDSIVNIPSIQVAPRIGLAWDVFGNGKTAVRTGFGVFPDRFNDDQILQMVQSPPLVYTNKAYYTTITDLLNSQLSLSPSGVYGVQRDFHPPTVYNWSFGVQQNIGFGTTLDVAYVGNTQKHLLDTRDLNAEPYGTNFKASSIDPTVSGNKPYNSNLLRNYIGFQGIDYLEFSGYGNYNAMQVQLTKRFSHSFTFHTAYSWSKALDLTDSIGGTVNPVLNPRMRNYGPASFDRKHNLTLNYVYDIPSVSKRWDNRFSRIALDGWEISGISTFMKGGPASLGYNLTYSADLTGATGDGIDSRVVTVDKVTTRGSGGQWINPNSVKPPTAAYSVNGMGTAAKYLFTNPGLNNWDISLFKNFKLGSNEARRLQFRFETYNTFNHTQFTGIDTTARFDAAGNQLNTNFGNFTSAALARRIAIGLKFYF